MTTSTIAHPPIVSRDQWLFARKELLTKEKELTRHRDAVNAERRRPVDHAPTRACDAGGNRGVLADAMATYHEELAKVRRAGASSLAGLQYSHAAFKAVIIPSGMVHERRRR